MIALTQEDIKKVLALEKVIESVEKVYILKSNAQTAVWPSIEYHFEEEQAVMDIRSGYVRGEKLHGAKMLNNFPLNAQKGMASFTGLLLVFDSTTGMPLGILDASYITSMRTGAAAALGVRALARKNTKNLLLVGAGRQAFYMLAATLLTMPGIQHVMVKSPLHAKNAEIFVSQVAQRLKEELHIHVGDRVSFRAVEDLPEALAQADALITITRSTAPLIKREWVKPGTHISCIGADMIGKQELDPELFRVARAFSDDTKQCLQFGEMQSAVRMGILTETSVVAELGEVLSGKMPGRISEEDITIFDATGLALLDIATGKVAIDLAMEKGLGQSLRWE